MPFADRYGSLSSLDAAKSALIEIERELTPRQKEYLFGECWEKPDSEGGYDLLRLSYTVMGLQKVIIMNGQHLNFSTIPRIWWQHEQRSAHSG